jgi:hypothetical protein
MNRRPKSFGSEEMSSVPAADASAILQVKIWLTGISPSVWRRTLVPTAFTALPNASRRCCHGVAQQMQWTKRGAHLLLQTRTGALDGTLRPLFEKSYPGLANDNSAETAQAEGA